MMEIPFLFAEDLHCGLSKKLTGRKARFRHPRSIHASVFKFIVEGKNNVIHTVDKCPELLFAFEQLPISGQFEGHVFLNGKETDDFLAIQKDVTLELSGYRKLLESEEQFRTLVNSMDDIVFTLDNEFKYTGVYGTWMSEAGFSPGQFLGKTAVEIFGEEEGNPHHEQARKAFGGRSTIYEWSYLNGLERRFVQTSLSPVYGGNGRPHALVGLGRDVTRMKRVEQEQATALLRQRLLFHSVAERIFTLDAQGRCTLINKTAIELLGWSEEELLGRDIHVLIHHLQQDGKPSKEKECHVLGALRTGQSYRDIEDVFWKKDGRWFDVEFNAEPIEMNGTMVGTVVSFSDLSEHKRDEQILRESVQQYRALMDGASDAIAIVALTTEILSK